MDDVIEVKYPEVRITGFLSTNTTFCNSPTTFLRKKDLLQSDMIDCTHLQC